MIRVIYYNIPIIIYIGQVLIDLVYRYKNLEIEMEMEYIISIYFI